jgi:hypothetical protein
MGVGGKGKGIRIRIPPEGGEQTIKLTLRLLECCARQCTPAKALSWLSSKAGANVITIFHASLD